MDYQIAAQKIRPKARIARHHLTKYARPLKDFVEHKVAEGRYNGASEYVRELNREDEKRKARERLDTLLLEGLAGEESPLTREDLDDIRKEALSRLGPPKKSG